jgi:hypothetical protein
MRWEKRGLVFASSGQRPWMVSHCANPVAEHLQDDVFRVYFGARDERSRSHIGYVDVEIGASIRVLDIARDAVVAPGPRGAFDDSGTSVGCLVRHGDRRYFYYIGWNLGVTVPWRNSIGLAVSNGDPNNFAKVSQAPIVDRSSEDPFSVSYPWVLVEPDRWRMWYGSNLRWGEKDADMDHVIKYAESADGVHWRRNNVIAMNLTKEEGVLCRPCVLHDGRGYRMWYCHRGQSYRLGYAESSDGIHWERCHDQVGIDVSPDGWDSGMIAYPCVFMHRNRYHLLYNGNRYGLTGFGLAVAE